MHPTESGVAALATRGRPGAPAGRAERRISRQVRRVHPVQTLHDRMSSVDRVKFTRDLASYSTSISSDTLRNAGLEPEQINSIAGADHVISGEEEYGRLFDQLEALDRAGAAQGGSGRTGNLDRAGD